MGDHRRLFIDAQSGAGVIVSVHLLSAGGFWGRSLERPFLITCDHVFNFLRGGVRKQKRRAEGVLALTPFFLLC